MSRIADLIQELCPHGVPYIELQVLFNIRNGYTPSKSDTSNWTNGTVPWFRMEDIRDNGRLLEDSIQRIPQSAVKGGRAFPANSILVATSATIGEHALITVPHLSNQRFTSLALKPEFADKLDMKFVFYYGFVLDEWCKNNTTVSSFASVDMAGFKKFRFPVPPLAVQREIVRILDQFTALEAELEAELETRRRQYAYYRDLLLTHPQADVRWVPMGAVCVRVSSGATPLVSRSDYYEGGDIPWIRTQEVVWRDVFDSEIKITSKAVRETAVKWIPENCVIVAISGATAGRAAVNKVPLTTNQHCCNLEIDAKQADYRYVFHWVTANYEKLKALGRGTRADLNSGLIKSFPIAVPPLATQHEIVSVLDKFDALVNDLSSGLPAELNARRQQYAYYRDRLLTFKELAP